ncbi:MAG: DEAD/DEAH box helicase [Actinobacteria bacterium]|nr:DEAD/DEAH box helicase [Actinomycetota bacterium]
MIRSLSLREIKDRAQRQLDGIVSDEDLEVLEAHEEDWVTALHELRRAVLATIDHVSQTVTGPERRLVLSDFEAERDRIERMLLELTGERFAQTARQEQDEQPSAPEDEALPKTGTPQLQLSWHDGRIVAWSAGERAPGESRDDVLGRLQAAGASVDRWEPHDVVVLPDGERAAAVSAPVQTSLGWLVSLGAGGDEERGVSVTWMGLAAALAVRLVARGRALPQLAKVGDAAGNRSHFAVHWEPALVDHDELHALTTAMPGAIAVLERQRDARAVTQTVVAGFVDAICRDGAGRVEVPSPPPQPRSASDVAETLLCKLDGTSFEAPHQHGIEIAKGLRSWSAGATGALKITLTVRLDPPDDGEAWLVRTLTEDGGRSDVTVEAAMSRASHNRKEALKRELERLERLYPPLMRGRDSRRGQVVLGQDEAWELMATAGPVLASAGVDVQVPPLSRRKATPSLRVTSIEGETAVGAQQLTAVRWSAVFDDVELTTEEIRRLASESRPMVKSHGQWVEVDHADLEAAAEALAERADRTRMTGADMLRHALGLDGAALGRTVSVAGQGWAADLLRSATEIPEHPPTRPQGFNGELRGYQANALAWLEFLDSAGLGGCLALDMGLGKTPTVLAHLWQTKAQGPALVIAPSAVVGNWAAEAARFVPGLRTVIHHGADRVDTAGIADEVATADVLVTTYGTAVRDIDGLADVQWGKVVLDEAQVIKNPTSVTAQQLRRLEAHNRIVLTGTPIENGLGDLWALMDFVNPGLVGDRATFVAQMHQVNEAGSTAESALRTLNGVLVFRRTKAEPVIAAELPDRIDKLNHCPMTSEQIGLYQAVLDQLVAESAEDQLGNKRKGAVLAAITALKQICNHPEAYTRDGGPLEGRSGKLARLVEITDDVFEAGERMLIFTHFAEWGEKLAAHLTDRTGIPIACYHGGLTRTVRDEMVRSFQEGTGPGALVLSLKAGGTGLNLTAASHVVLYDRWWNPAVEDQARDRAWRIGQDKTVIAHRLVCPGTVDERVEEVVAGKRRIADLALPKSSSIDDLDSDQLRRALGIDTDALLTDEYAELVSAGGVS